jgi:hypothetical protein
MEKEPGEVYWSVIDPIWDSISIYDGSEVFLLQFGKVRPELGYLFASHWCQSEVYTANVSIFLPDSTSYLSFIAPSPPACLFTLFGLP